MSAIRLPAGAFALRAAAMQEHDVLGVGMPRLACLAFRWRGAILLLELDRREHFDGPAEPTQCCTAQFVPLTFAA